MRMEIDTDTFDRPDKRRVVADESGELEDLRLYKSEHERLKAKLNAILHPDGGAPRKPSFCDLVAYTRSALKEKKLAEMRVKVISSIFGGMKWADAGPLETFKPEGEKYITAASFLEFLDWLIANKLP